MSTAMWRLRPTVPAAATTADVKSYVSAYQRLESLKAGFELHRAFPQDASFNREHHEVFEVPILAAGGDHSGGPMLPMLARGLRAAGAASVSEVVIPNCGHLVTDEQPQAFASMINISNRGTNPAADIS